MILKQEILKIATYANLSPHVIEKDYVLGWLLAGINHHNELGHNWIFKGGTCLKKCLFETYRFSEDLDFTLREEKYLNEFFLKESFMEISEWVYENSGIELISSRMAFDLYKNPRKKISCEGRIYYRGPLAPTSPRQVPRIKLDLTNDELIADQPRINSVNHPYSDVPTHGIQALCYSYTEIFAEKIRALAERARPRDLYDIILFYCRIESKKLAVQTKEILQKKCQFKGISLPTYNNILQSREIFSTAWKEQLSHQLQTLPPFESFWNELPEFFNWLHQEKTPSTSKDEIQLIS